MDCAATGEHLTVLDWVDPATRVVFVDFNVYNPNTDMFKAFECQLSHGIGTVVPSYSVVSAQLMKLPEYSSTQFSGRRMACRDMTLGLCTSNFFFSCLVLFP